MFDFLKKPTHHHELPHKIKQDHKVLDKLSPPTHSKENINLSVIPKILQEQISRNNLKKPARIKQYQESSEVRLSKEVQSKLKTLLHEAKDSIKNVNANEIISNQMKLIQKRVFIRYTSSNQHQYLQELYEKTTIEDQNVKSGLSDLIFGAVDSITWDIENSKFDHEVIKQKILTRDQIIQAEQMKQIHSIKKKEGQISSKVGQLRMELHIVQDPYIIAKAKSILQKDTYSKGSQKTKEAQKFVQLKKFQRQEIQRKKKEEIEKKKIKQLQQKVTRQKQLQKAKTQRHAKLIQKLQAKQMLKQKRQEEVESEKERFSRFLKQYRKEKPLYQKKIEEQMEREIQERKIRFQKMSERKGSYNPISLLEIEDFEQKYLELKREQQEKKKIELLIKKDEEKLRLQQLKDKNYKGKYRYFVLEQMVNRQAKNKEEEFSKRLMLERKRAYSVDIKQKHKPTVDENKRMESLNFLAQAERKTKQKGTHRVRLNSSDQYDHNTISYDVQEQQEPDPRREGQKNMRLFKQYIHEKIRRGQVKRPETLESSVSVFTPKIDYLKSQRENRETNTTSIFQSLDASSRIKKIKMQANGDIGLLKLKAQELDEKTRRQQLKLKYSEHTPIEEKQLEENYIASIQAKLQLLNNVK